MVQSEIALEREPERAKVLDRLRAHGWNATSFQVLEPGFCYWFDESGAVAYVDTGGAWVAAGAPIAAEERLATCASRFVRAARDAGRRACFFGVEPRFLRSADFASLLIGEQPVWDPRRVADSRPVSKSLREQLRRARAKGVEVRRLGAIEISDAPGSRRRDIERLIERWSSRLTLAPMGFLVAVHPFHFVAEHRYFVAERDGRIVAFLGMVPVYARNGWLLEDFLRDPTAPNGTVELVIDHALRAVAEENAAYATLGLAPLSGDVSGWLRAIRDASSELYDFHGLRAFKAKLSPDRWDEIHLAFPSGQSGPRAVLDVLTAFSKEGLLRFGIETFLRVPGTVIQLALLLLAPALIAGLVWFLSFELACVSLPQARMPLARVVLFAAAMLPAVGAWLAWRRFRRRSAQRSFPPRSTRR